MNIKGSYKKDCIFLLKDLTGVLKEISVEEKEKLIEEGISYSNFISKEDKPSYKIEDLFLKILDEKASEIAKYVSILTEKIYEEKQNNLVIVSLARAGTPYGILIRRYLKFKYDIDIKHYSISIIRGKGIDFNALKYILDKNKNAKIQFVDGWTGKGSIINELNKSISEFNKKYKENIDSSLAVIADPAKLCEIYGTREDICVPNSILNSTVSGLISRTILNEQYIGEKDFHGAININYLKDQDYSEYYVNEIEKHFKKDIKFEKCEKIDIEYAKKISEEIKRDYKVKDINKIKLSIGEASRVLLRRKARVLLLKDKYDKDVKQLITLAKEKNVPIEIYKKGDYKAAAIIEEKKEIHFITDLDRTLIHAKNKGHKCVEYIEKSEITYMTQKSYEDFLKLLKIKEFNFIPCTMRNITQTLRVNFIKDYNPKIIICTNGAQIYIDGKLDEDWNIKMKSLIDEKSIEENIKLIKSLNLNYDEVRNIENFYITIKCGNQKIASEVFNILKDKFDLNIKVTHIAKKIFIIDKRIDKIHAVDYIVDKYKIKDFITAGDSSVDENFTKRGKAIIPKHASFKHKNALVTDKEGIESTEDIIEYLQRELTGI